MFEEIAIPEIMLILFAVSMIWIILNDLHKVMGKPNAVSAGILFTIVMVTFLSNGHVIYDNLNETFGEYFVTLSFGITIILAIIFVWIPLDLITKSLDYIIHRQAKQTVSAKLSKKSKLCLGGYLIFDVKFTGWLFAGYYMINIQSPYLEEKQTFIQYNDVKKLGVLKGKYTDKSLQLRCNIPKHWGCGRYSITVSINDVYKWRFSLKKIMNLSSENLKVNISEPLELTG